MEIKKSHWVLKTVGALNVTVWGASTFLLTFLPQWSEAFLMVSLLTIAASVIGGIMLWKAASTLERAYTKLPYPDRV